MIHEEHFSRTDIDAIDENIAQNYFTPVLLDVLNLNKNSGQFNIILGVTLY